MNDPGKASAPARAATRLPKRFYKSVSIEKEGAGFALLLDGKPVRTPAKAQLLLPARALAEAVAEEWRAQGERIDPAAMPLTKLANSAIDGVAGREEAVIDDILAHAGADLLCYRANGSARSGRGATEAVGSGSRLGQIHSRRAARARRGHRSCRAAASLARPAEGGARGP